jgi:4-hydroxy-4-methyl-2-oxoglutarate aldolase
MEKTMKDKIIDFIKRNRVCTTEVADCLGKSGALENVMPINQGQFKVGNVHWVYTHEESNWEVHEQVVDTKENDIVFIEAFDCNNRAIIGELVTKYIILYRQASAIVCNAKFRDAAALLKEKYPVWCTGFTPVGCFNRKPMKELDADIISKHRAMYDGAIAVCDDCGVVIIPKELHTEEFLQKLHHIEDQEDIWFDRLDHYKDNTFQIVCLKNYLKESK